jgi:mycothiol synthase
VSSSREVLSWRALEQSDLPAVTNLARRCLSADGGQPFAADPGFLAQWYRSEAETYAGWDGPELICVSSLRRLPAGAPGERRAANAVTTGLVHPAWRRRGIGERAFAGPPARWVMARCAQRPKRSVRALTRCT